MCLGAAILFAVPVFRLFGFFRVAVTVVIGIALDCI